MGRSLRHGCAVVLCTLLALALPWQRPSVPWPTYYQEPLDLIFSKGKRIMKAKGRPVRIQLLDDLDTSNFLAAIAASFLKKKPKGRCAIVVSNLNVAAATYEKLLENDLKAHQISLARRYREKPDPSISVAVCTLRSWQLLLGQSFDIKAFGLACAPHQQDRSWINPEKVAAGLYVEVGPSFYGLNVDYSYTWEQAHADDHVAAMQGLVMPLRGFETAEVWEALAKVIQQHAEWAPMVIFFNHNEERDSCTSLLQSMGISAAPLPSVRVFHHKKDDELVQDYFKSLADCFKKLEEGDLQVLCTCQRQHDAWIPDSVRSIVWVSKHEDGARSFPRSLFKALCRQRGSSLTFIHIIYGTLRFFFRTKLAAMSLAFYLGWPQVGEMVAGTMAQKTIQSHQLADLDQIAARFDKSKGATLELLTPHGEIVPMTEQNARDAIYSDNITLLCTWLQSEKRIPGQRFGTVEGDHWKTWRIARDMLEEGRMSAETKRLLSKVSSVDVIPTMQKQISARRDRPKRRRKTDLD